MKRGSTIFLKMAVLLIGLPILGLCIYGIPWLANHPVNPNYAGSLYPIVIMMYISVIPFIIALFQSFRLLSYIDKNEAFSSFSVRSLKIIKYCAIVISSLYLVMLPFVFLVADKDDAPGLIIVGMVPIFASLVIAVFSAVLQRLLQEAIDIKSENDLVV
ncbi:DUF2975 domain-containing protein [Paenibacillus sp. CC-CFT742]|uniref:DUF2975 domain-containing protein n=1 Tax=Paenibacillus xylanilyticus TaxID=248903 RepID=UPI00257756EC|nr:DUF2975 domain-containing protein [Paenibacillus sp. CC-CFT742]WJH29545.1 DUF2975 domain-containing protein [Paenibacillus sp. CC-CFT742]